MTSFLLHSKNFKLIMSRDVIQNLRKKLILGIDDVFIPGTWSTGHIRSSVGPKVDMSYQVWDLVFLLMTDP